MTTATEPKRRQMFQPASRKKRKLRMAIDGPSGGGKTFTAIRLGMLLGESLAVIDTEHGSSALYQGVEMDGQKWEFDQCVLETFSPQEYVAKIEAAGNDGYDVLVIDSLSHAWEGADGALEMVNKKGGNSYTAWKDVTPVHRRMVEAILRSPCHVIVTMRSKTEYVLETNSAGKQVPRKIGMAPIQRPGMEYEFDLYCSMDWSNILTVTKSRCSALNGAIVHKPGGPFAESLLAWLETGATPEAEGYSPITATPDQVGRIVGLIGKLQKDVAKEKLWITRKWATSDFALLTGDQSREYEARLQAEFDKKKGVTTNGEVATQAVQDGLGAAHALSSPAAQTLQEALTTENPSVAGAPATDIAGPCTIIQRDAITAAAELLFDAANIDHSPEHAAARQKVWASALQKRGVLCVANLTEAQAVELTAAFEGKAAELRAAKRGGAQKK